jgi:hypothetical protein
MRHHHHRPTARALAVAAPLALALLALTLAQPGCSVEKTHAAAAPQPADLPPEPARAPEPAPAPDSTQSAAQAVQGPPKGAEQALDLDRLQKNYPWLSDSSRPHPLPAHHLHHRFPEPPGYQRVELEDGSFGAFLRELPLAAPGTPVLSHRGATILHQDHPNLAAVAAIDVGDADLQQCADSIIRLHAEWAFARGRRDHSYRGASGLELPFSRYLKGERLVYRDKQLSWQSRGKPRRADHITLRDYLDSVFAWANTGSLANQAQKIPREQLRPGDFFVVPGGPGHAVLILDVAAGPDGRLALLLGQGFMPAQNFQVLRPAPGQAWFIVEPADQAVATPFWAPFPWGSLRRLS